MQCLYSFFLRQRGFYFECFVITLLQVPDRPNPTQGEEANETFIPSIRQIPDR